MVEEKLLIMNNTQENLLSQLSDLRQLFAESAPDDPKVVTNYAWIIVKVLLQHTDEIDSVTARQLLAECLKLPIERPSQLYSALLAAAVKVANAYPEFRFASFLRMWGIENLRPEDHQCQQATVPDGSPSGVKNFPSLSERTAKALAHSLLLHPEDLSNLKDSKVSPHKQGDLEGTSGLSTAPDVFPSCVNRLLTAYGLSVHPMLVTRIKQATGRDGRKYTFVTLTSPEGLEIESTSHNLHSVPLHPLPEGKRHYVNIGQLYNCLLKTKTFVPDVFPSDRTAPVPSDSSLVLKEAYLSQQRANEVFSTEIGYIESIDPTHAHMHIYDAYSRHFVAPIQRFSKEKAGDFVRFIPVTPATSKFKTAIIQGIIPSSSILATVPSDSSETQPLLRVIRITNINKEKGYAAWELIDKSHPITELLSPLQLTEGETSPTFTSGYFHLAPDGRPQVSCSSTIETISPGQTLLVLIYLKRGKDRQKRPHVAQLFNKP